ncbi:hypothetical protein [Streptomyces sp. NPDC002825]|uniref:hypothetical protein n=1 Tax=Streptomyces sp. NPDC002825 TaxID=3154666 RepID=UPI00332A2464
MRTTLSRRRLSVSVAVVLAVAAATPVLAPAAVAAPVSAAATAAAPIQVPFLASGGTITGAGATGFLSVDPDGVSRWTKYADGTSKVVPTGFLEYAIGSGSDHVAVVKQVWHTYEDSQVTLYDMANGSAPVTVGLGGEARGHVEGVVGTDVVAQDGDGPVFGKIVSKEGADVSVRAVTNADGSLARGVGVGDYLPGVVFSGKTVVDLKTGHTVETYQSDDSSTSGDVEVISPSHVAWTERADGRVVLASAVRGTDAVKRAQLDYDGDARLVGGLLGAWFMSDNIAPTGGSTPPSGFTARSLTDGTSFPLLAHATSVKKGPGDTLLVLGTTAEHGKGVYRVALGADGKPAAELIASTGQTDGGTAPLEYLGHAVPASMNLDGVAKTRLAWKFSTTKADLDIEFKHTATGRTYRETVRPGTTGTGVFPDGSLGLDWSGDLREYAGWGYEQARNGAYEWKVTARPWNGMPSVTASGTTEVVRTPRVHDYTDNGSPDLFVRPASGYLDRLDTRWDDAAGRLVEARPGWDSSVSGLNWNTYDRVESAGDLAGSTAPDVVSRDTSGVLWLHLGNKTGWIEQPARKVGGGWGVYNLLAGGSELTGDGRADLVAVDKAGDLYLYKGTGYASAPYAPRRKIGFGWGIYNELVAVGNVAGAPAGDLVARDKAGVLWLYLGKGDGTYAPRVRIGAGWNEYRDIIGIGDGNKDGRPDLYVRTATNKAYFYAGTGSWRAPFAARSATQVGVAPAGTTYSQVF